MQQRIFYSRVNYNLHANNLTSENKDRFRLAAARDREINCTRHKTFRESRRITIYRSTEITSGYSHASVPLVIFTAFQVPTHHFKSITTGFLILLARQLRLKNGTVS